MIKPSDTDLAKLPEISRRYIENLEKELINKKASIRTLRSGLTDITKLIGDHYPEERASGAYSFATSVLDNIP